MPENLGSRCPVFNQAIGLGQTSVLAFGTRYHSRCFENHQGGPFRHVADPDRSEPSH